MSFQRTADGRSVAALNSRGAETRWAFRNVFSDCATQSAVFDATAAPLVPGCLNGISAGIIVYGQTGSGKTHTMCGERWSDPTAVAARGEGASGDGIIPRTIALLFERIAERARDGVLEFDVRASFIELYNESIADLLAPRDCAPSKVEIHGDRERNLFVTNSTEVPVVSRAQMESVFQSGAARRRTSSTGMHGHSSRSHAILIVTVARLDLVRSETKCVRLGVAAARCASPRNSLGTFLRHRCNASIIVLILHSPSHCSQSCPSVHARCRYAQLYLVDLAGSESVKKTNAVGQRLDEAKSINTSLLALANVIRRLSRAAQGKRGRARRGARARGAGEDGDGDGDGDAESSLGEETPSGATSEEEEEGGRGGAAAGVRVAAVAAAAAAGTLPPSKQARGPKRSAAATKPKAPKAARAATTERAPHVPYRDSKLTRLLQNCLGGSARTCIILTLSPSAWNFAETMSTLRFGTSCQCISNRPQTRTVVGIRQLEAVLKELNATRAKQRAEIARLESELGRWSELFAQMHVTAPPSKSAALPRELRASASAPGPPPRTGGARGRGEVDPGCSWLDQRGEVSRSEVERYARRAQIDALSAEVNCLFAGGGAAGGAAGGVERGASGAAAAAATGRFLAAHAEQMRRDQRRVERQALLRAQAAKFPKSYEVRYE